MRAAAQIVVGTHDFTSFAASDPDLTARRSAEPGGERDGNIRTLFDSRWEQRGDLLVYRVRGNGFLHNMVRNLVGTFIDAGRGRLSPENLRDILAAHSRSAAGATAPARGLFLDTVEYPPPVLA